MVKKQYLVKIITDFMTMMDENIQINIFVFIIILIINILRPDFKNQNLYISSASILTNDWFKAIKTLAVSIQPGLKHFM
jgi:hypothetical protein